MVFSKRKAWLIARPARRWLDVTLFFPERRAEDFVHKIQPRYTGRALEHVIRLRAEEEFEEPVLKFLRAAYDDAECGLPSRESARPFTGR